MKSIINGCKRRVLIGLFIAVVCTGLVTGPPTPSYALEQTELAIGVGIFSTIAVGLAAYGIYENLPSRQGQPRLIPGEFYVGGYLGGVYTPSQDLRYSNGFTLAQPGSVFQPSVTLRNSNFQPGVVGGLKLGYFFTQWIPYLGLEVETNYNRNAVRNQSVSTSRPINGFNFVNLPSNDWVNWTMAFHIIGRYGFLPDAEVPFGRLQPYIGIGPGFVVMYDETDAAKNFSIDALVGLRVMVLKNVSAFVEYKYSHQFDAEMDAHAFVLPNGTLARGTAHLDFDSHKFVLGVTYHF